MTSDAMKANTGGRGRLGELIDERIRGLQQRYLNNVSSAVSDLAALRRASSSPPGADPRVWELTLAGLGTPAGAPDDPTAEERAAHAALGLYAIHQQSRVRPMHVPGRGLGRACFELGRKTAAEAAVRRRFQALGTAATFPEAMHHARGLIRQLRSADVPLDYAQFADDLVALQSPSGAQRVRLQWGRDYHRTRPADNDRTSAESEETA